MRRRLLLSHRELDFAGLLDDFGGLQDLEADDATVVPEVGNDTRTHLIALLAKYLKGVQP